MRYFAVEGAWTVWGPYGICTGTCDSTAMHNRTRNYTGGTMPCTGNDTEVTIGCHGEALIISNTGVIIIKYYTMHRQCNRRFGWLFW